ENWPGIKHTTGVELSGMFADHLRSYEPDILEGVKVSGITRGDDGTFTVACDDGSAHQAAAVLIATGQHPRELGIPGEKEYRSKGVSYCTTCDGPLFKGKVTATVGGGNSALESALMLSDIAEKVYVINKNPAFKGEKTLMDKLEKRENVELIFEAMTSEITGDGKFATGLKYTDKAGTEHALEVNGIFVHIGSVPNSTMAPEGTAKNEFGEIQVNTRGETNIPGLFAAGDVTGLAHKQIVIAAGQACAATLSAVQYLNSR
ncbi:MAG TPA: FAD-dependent oxidoreductase, partial [Candidatus Paceibacterota bacterium]|nr:FAD-dependent oxidoreductase [Candidatus Paceibacterota bacterium]